MQPNKLLLRTSTGFVLFCALSILSVSVMALVSPQAVMNLVDTRLTNADAVSSIRGVYGGVGVTFLVVLLYTLRRNRRESLGLLSLFWGLYAACRLLTIVTDGALGSFGTRWLLIELSLCVVSLILWRTTRKG